MKTQILKKRIIRNFSVAGVFLLIFVAIFYFYSHEKSGVQSKIDGINQETSQLGIELADLQSRTAEIKKYKDMWPTIPANKKDTNGIKTDEINSKLSSFADKYSIGDLNIKLSLPEVMKGGVFQRQTVDVMMMTANISFTAASDVKAVMFVNDLINSLKGYPVVTSFSISKIRDSYSQSDLVNLSTGKSLGLINGKLDFYWYVYKEQDKKEKETSNKSENGEVSDAQVNQ